METYGCQMNVNDSEIVASILKDAGYSFTDSAKAADVILINTCSVREHAEARIFEKIKHLQHFKKSKRDLKIGILGCMAERLRNKLIDGDSIVDLVVGPDEYRKVPALLDETYAGQKGIAVRLSRVEAYENIIPLRKEGISAWVSIMRGCDHFCSYCVVPYTRGRERSRSMITILNEIEKVEEEGFKEVTLLGQNVNAYKEPETGKDFSDLLEETAKIFPAIRIRYITSHPAFMSDKLIETMAKYDNICKFIHLPVQSGSDRILDAMKRDYTFKHFYGRIEKIRELMPDCALSTDIIAGFPTETFEDHKATLDAVNLIRFDGAFMFKYSPREGTRAYHITDDVSEEEKIRRLNEIIDLQHKISKEINLSENGRIHEVLIEGSSRRNNEEMTGRTDTNKKVVIKTNGFENKENGNNSIKIGDLVKVKIFDSTAATLFGEMIK